MKSRQIALAGSVLAGSAIAGALLAQRRARRGTGRPLQIREVCRIRRPVDELFDLWRHPGNLPKFMEHISRVDELGNGRSHWVMRGPFSHTFEWDAEIVREVKNREIEWWSLPDAEVASHGWVRFRPHGDDVEISVFLEYHPPAGRAGAHVARLLGQSPASELREDLRRLKQSLEAGEVPTVIGQPSGRRSRPLSLARLVDA